MYLIVTPEGSAAHNKISSQTNRSARSAGFKPIYEGWFGDGVLATVVQMGGVCDSHSDTPPLDDGAIVAAIKQGWIREATREEVLVYSLRGKL